MGAAVETAFWHVAAESILGVAKGEVVVKEADTSVNEELSGVIG